MKKLPLMIWTIPALGFTLACSLFTQFIAPSNNPPLVPSTPTLAEFPTQAIPTQIPATIAPPPTAEPVLTTVFQDDFSNSDSGWDRADWDSGITDYYNNAYQMLVRVPNYDIWANPGRYFAGNVRVEVDVIKVGGELNDDYGLICHYSGEPSSPNYYYFIMSSDGYAVIGKVTNGERSYLSNEYMEESAAIQQGYTTNHLRADCFDGRLVFYINNQMVATATDSSYMAGDIGFIAGTFDASNVEIYFDNLVVLQP